ncbi:pesticidal crystal protein cry1Ac [Elysia marginata]|uniref:Pesticidal crystal protein cry1Ac n=1 Tax=Elysia marginata TaxID=1093978 RepID=A0AAV4HHT3_9GAST|nr:pesticidal crystal protein cry1Ac [Elysia marginata]
MKYAEVNRWWNFRKPEDAFDLIWHDFETAGYRTFYCEDSPRGGGFFWGKRSFIYPQTRYWSRPIELAMFDEPGFFRRNGSCFGSRTVPEYHLEYFMRFLDTFPNKPVAGITFIIKLVHDDSTKAVIIDEYIQHFFKTLEARGHLNKSLVMFFSDHGQRWGKIRQTYNGIVESRNPFLILTFPAWFRKKYPEIVRNLNINTRRLTSHFDTRQMLLDLLYFKGREPTPPYRGRNGLSLFTEIPANRTCKDAGIPSNQCLCGQGVQKFLKTSDLMARTLGDALLKAVKKKSDPVHCEVYKLDKLLQVGVLSVPGASYKEKRRYIVASVRLTVKPGGAMFEGNVHLNLDTKHMSVDSNIERLNMYQGEVECQPTSREQMYCYCKGNIKKTLV